MTARALTMTYLLTARSLSGSSNSLVSHGKVSISQRERASWYNDEHHSHSLLTRNLNGFKNPWKSFHKPTLWEVASGASLKKIEEGVHAVDERDPVEVAEESLEVVQPTWGADATSSVDSDSTGAEGMLTATWLGHAGALVQMPFGGSTINVLVDPIFSERSSPAQTAGPTRIVKTPCSVSDLPPIHVLIISHNQ